MCDWWDFASLYKIDHRLITSDVAMAEVVGIVTKITSSFLEINQVSAKCQQAWMPVQSVKTWCQKSEVSRMQDLDAGCC